MMVTDFKSAILDVGDKIIMLATFFVMLVFFNVLNRSPTS